MIVSKRFAGIIDRLQKILYKSAVDWLNELHDKYLSDNQIQTKTPKSQTGDVNAVPYIKAITTHYYDMTLNSSYDKHFNIRENGSLYFVNIVMSKQHPEFALLVVYMNKTNQDTFHTILSNETITIEGGNKKLTSTSFPIPLETIGCYDITIYDFTAAKQMYESLSWMANMTIHWSTDDWLGFMRTCSINPVPFVDYLRRFIVSNYNNTSILPIKYSDAILTGYPELKLELI